MSLIFRLLYTLIAARYRPPVPTLGPCRTPFRVWPNDLDVLGHVNNGRYLTVMDLARTDLMIRSGMFSKLLANSWYPVAASETIQFIKPLGPFDYYEIETRVLGWDDRAFYMQQRFLREEQEVAWAVVRARFLKIGGGTVDPQQIISVTDYEGDSPKLPDWVQRWSDDQSEQRAQKRRERRESKVSR